MAEGDYAEDLHELASHGSGVFLMACVVVPSLVGIAARLLVGEGRLAAVRPYLKLANSANLLVLSYSNASAALPQAIASPDWDFLGAILAITSALCVLAFASGGAIAGRLGAGPSTRASLMYGLGMNNNGTGLVLASMSLADHPRVMLPIIIYNLVQQVVAGAVRTGSPSHKGGGGRPFQNEANEHRSDEAYGIPKDEAKAVCPRSPSAHRPKTKPTPGSRTPGRDPGMASPIARVHKPMVPAVQKQEGATASEPIQRPDSQRQRPETRPRVGPTRATSPPRDRSELA
jgi:hypothetical protein